MIVTETSVVRISIKTNDDTFRRRFFDAIIAGRCPDFESSIRSTGSSTVSFWLPEHVPAVRAWIAAGCL